MEALFFWQVSGDGRHFVVRFSGTCTETRWRVCVWVKRELEDIEGTVGEGFGETLHDASVRAIGDWEDRSSFVRKGAGWYVPSNVAEILQAAQPLPEDK